MEIENINTWFLEKSDSKVDNEFESFLWKRAKNISKKSTKITDKNSLVYKKNLIVNETVKSISDEIEEYMVDYLKLMEFSKDHSKEISSFFAKNLKTV